VAVARDGVAVRLAPAAIGIVTLAAIRARAAIKS
jgi:hypothetical protein